jgi:multisubunit Na+/H+ antiporter MnhE subunit
VEGEVRVTPQAVHLLLGVVLAAVVVLLMLLSKALMRALLVLIGDRWVYKTKLWLKISEFTIILEVLLKAILESNWEEATYI